MLPARRFLPSISLLAAFEAAARTGSVTTAARELDLTQSAVSRQIKALEQELTVQLVRRGAQRNELTDAGEILFAGVYKAMQAIEQSVGQITGSGTREILNVSVAPFFSAAWLTPRLTGRARPAARPASWRIPNSQRFPSPIWIATRSMPLSRSATTRRWPISR